jgi:hypothetical protein
LRPSRIKVTDGFGEERGNHCRHLPPLRNSHGGMAFGVDHKP